VIDDFFEVIRMPAQSITPQLTEGTFLRLERVHVREIQGKDLFLQLSFNPRRDIYEETIGYDVLGLPQ
jgi:hypothetical protein